MDGMNMAVPMGSKSLKICPQALFSILGEPCPIDLGRHKVTTTIATAQSRRQGNRLYLH
jgi:hypothetical protein